jgi:dihydroneopterin aldolase
LEEVLCHLIKVIVVIGIEAIEIIQLQTYVVSLDFCMTSACSPNSAVEHIDYSLCYHHIHMALSLFTVLQARIHV